MRNPPFQGLANAMAREESRMVVKTNTVMQMAWRRKYKKVEHTKE
jgi:hypothetical protein